MKDNTEIETLFGEENTTPKEQTNPVSHESEVQSTPTVENQVIAPQPETTGTVIGQVQNDNVIATGAEIPENNGAPVLGKPIMVETVQPSKKPKKKMNKTTLLVLIILGVVIIACGGYLFYNNVFNKPVIINLRDLTIELGEKVPTEITKYVDKMEGKESDYSLNLSSVVENKVGTYTYRVTYKKQGKNGTITIEDTTNPKLTLKDVTVKIGEEVKIEDFIETCEDESNCTYEYAEPFDSTLTEKTGTYDISIIAKDESENEITEKAKLIVTDENNTEPTDSTLTFTAKSQKNATLKAPLIYRYQLTFDENKKMKEVKLDIDLVFDTVADYTTVKNFTVEDWKKYMPTGSVTKQDESTKTITYHVENITLTYLQTILQNKNLKDDYDSLKTAFTTAGYQEVASSTTQP